MYDVNFDESRSVAWSSGMTLFGKVFRIVMKQSYCIRAGIRKLHYKYNTFDRDVVDSLEQL